MSMFYIVQNTTMDVKIDVAILRAFVGAFVICTRYITYIECNLKILGIQVEVLLHLISATNLKTQVDVILLVKYFSKHISKHDRKT
jgi:hypothetical protein